MSLSKGSQALLDMLSRLAGTTIAIRCFLTSFFARVFISHHAIVAILSSTASTTSADIPGRKARSQLQEEIEIAFETKLSDLLSLSAKMQDQFKTALQDSPHCMLPSYNYQLPSGHEHGKYLALDVGGSTFRVALVELQGTSARARIMSQRTYKINDHVKRLVGLEFFDWMASKIAESIEGVEQLKMGIAWSFPINQTSLRSGEIQGMGKGFCANHGLLGADLGNVIEEACQRKGLKISVSAIVNDSTATLLANAYTTSSTRFGLILGTGVNVAVQVPVSCLSSRKFGRRPSGWHEAATYVVVNTELSMFGGSSLPVTRWDKQLDRNHARPGFQPFEYRVSGRYLGEIARLILVEAVTDAGLFDGLLPESLMAQYSLETELLSKMQSAHSVSAAKELFEACNPTASVSVDDMTFVTTVARLITQRAAGLIAVSLHALWSLRAQASKTKEGRLTVGCNGSIIQLYPGFKESCQEHLDRLFEMSNSDHDTVTLEMAEESSLIGAAVAVVCA